MVRRIRLSELREMPADLQERVLDPFSVPSELNGERNELNRRIRKYEQERGCSSEELRSGLIRGEITEDADISSWLILLSIRDCFDKLDEETQSGQASNIPA